MSGDAVFPIALRMVYEVAHAVHIPVIGIGGVNSPERVLEMMLAGATAVEVGTASLINPYACWDIVLGLPEIMRKYGIEDIRDIIGGAPLA